MVKPKPNHPFMIFLTWMYYLWASMNCCHACMREVRTWEAALQQSCRDRVHRHSAVSIEDYVQAPNQLFEQCPAYFKIAVIGSAELISEGSGRKLICNMKLHRGVYLMQMAETLGKHVNAELWTDPMDLTINFKQREGKCKSWLFRRGTKEPISYKCFIDWPSSGSMCELNWLMLCIGIGVTTCNWESRA